jgi:hypothetical protein
MNDFTAKMGKPVHQDEYNGLSSLVYENIEVSGYTAYMLVYFSKNGLEGGTYYFLTYSQSELMKCYTEMQKELLDKYGPTSLQKNLHGYYDPAEILDPITKEPRIYESSWNMQDGYVYLKVNTRQNEPITLWYSSPDLTKMLTGS